MKQAIIYARFSPRPNPNLTTSIEVQIEKCQEYCKYRGYDVVATYRDAGISGKSKDRPGLNKAMVHVCRIKGILVVYSLDRFGRSLIDNVQLIDVLHKKKADLCLLDINIDTSTFGGQMVFVMLSAVAEYQRKQTGLRTSEALLYKQSQGQRISSKPPYGYKIDPMDKTRIVKVEYEQRIISLIVRLRGEGYTLEGIVEYLERREFEPRSRQWNTSQIVSVLKRHGPKKG